MFTPHPPDQQQYNGYIFAEDVEHFAVEELRWFSGDGRRDQMHIVQLPTICHLNGAASN